MSNVYIYARASSKGSKAHRQQNTIPAQIEDCTRWVESNGLSVTQVFEERESGDLEQMKRPVFRAMMKMVKEGDLVVVKWRDRLGRNAMDSMRISDDIVRGYSADVYSLDVGCRFSETYEDDGKYFSTMFKDRQAQHYLSDLREKTTRALKAKKERGERWTKVAPLGSQWSNDNMLINNDEESIMIEDIRGMRSSGMSFKDIAIQCELKSYLNRSGNVPSQSSLSKICKGIEIEIDHNLEGRKSRKRLEDTKAGMKEYIVSFKEQGLSMRKIADELNAMGYTTSRGGEIRHNQVARILKSIH